MQAIVAKGLALVSWRPSARILKFCQTVDHGIELSYGRPTSMHPCFDKVAVEHAINASLDFCPAPLLFPVPK